jgi:Mg-chelatase subunit ChlD
MRRSHLWVWAGLAIASGMWGCESRSFVTGNGDGGGNSGGDGSAASTDGQTTGGSGGSGVVLPDGSIGTGGGDAAGGAAATGGATATGGAAATGGTGGPTCGMTEITANSVPVHVLLVIDKSASMKTALATGTRWTAVKSALSAALDNVKGSISFGLEFFPNGGDSTQTCEVPSGDAAVVVPIGPGTTTVSAITTAFDMNQPAGATPTATALSRAYDYFITGGGKSLTGDRFVLLATDGGPNCNPTLACTSAACTLNLDDPNRKCGPPAPDGTPANCCDSKLPNGPSACLDDAATTDAIRRLATAGVRTFVVGIPGTEVYANSLDQIAIAGGAINPSAPPSYFAVNASGGVAGLTEVFSTITSRLITTCNLQLQSTPPDRNKINVSVDGSLVPSGPDGWALDTSTTPPTIVLKGATCTKVQKNGANTVKVVYGCPTVVID